MGLTIDDIYKLMLFIVKKNQSGSLTPENFDLIFNQGQRSYVAFLLGNFQTYQPGRPIAKVELGNNSVVRQRLSPVIYGYILNVNAITGQSPYPGDYIQTDSMYSIYGVSRIRYIDQKQLQGVYNSVIDPIATNPIYLLEDDNFQFYPVNTWQAKLHYVKDPPNVHWGYTTDANGRAVYSAAASVQCVFDDVAIYEILVRALQILGVNLQIGQVIAYAQEIKNLGE